MSKVAGTEWRERAAVRRKKSGQLRHGGAVRGEGEGRLGERDVG